jgi:peptidoglycan/LPS O-acetylase OafA/YrhL
MREYAPPSALGSQVKSISEGCAELELARGASTSTDPRVTVRPVRDQYIDVLRGLAIGLVILRHAWPDVFPGAGVVGVDVFFALSGYVITRVLDRDLVSLGRPRFARFYIHRVFRLYPALILVTGVYAVATLLWDDGVTHRQLAANVGAALLYLGDFPNLVNMTGPIGHLWTLAIEEQFYIVWPVLLWLAYRMTRRLGVVAVAVAVALTAVCLCTLALSAAPADIYELVTTWASSIAIGGAAYFYHEAIRRALGRFSGAAAILAVLVLLAACFYPDAKDHSITYILGPSLIALAAVVILNWATTPGNEVVRFDPLKPLNWLGRISYGVYLWNFPVTNWWNSALGTPPAWADLALIPLSIAPAVISWYTVEALGRWLRKRYDERGKRVPQVD